MKKRRNISLREHLFKGSVAGVKEGLTKAVARRGASFWSNGLVT